MTLQTFHVTRYHFAGALVLAALAAFYHQGATEHARIVNVARARADQSGYLWDAVAIHIGRHGGPKTLIGERNRMPVYPWLLSWLYDPAMSPDKFFEVAKRWNIRLSLVLLAVMTLVVRRYLPPLLTLNLTLVLAFGYFIFKAGYAQVELLYYVLFFLTFLTCCRLLESRRGTETVILSIAAGTLAAVTHLSKAAVLPLVVIFLLVYAAGALSAFARAARGGTLATALRTCATRAAAILVFTACFLGVLSPYLANSKRVFGRYFYNVNTTFYLWYDDWPAASMGTYSHGDGVGWPKMAPHDIPTMRTYIRDHTIAQIAGRFAGGLREMVTVSYTRLWYFKYVTMYVLVAVLLMASAWTAFASMIRAHTGLFLFLVLYALGYLLAVAFYKPISGTTLRMLLTHVAPLLFVLSCFFARAPFRDQEWTIGGMTLRPAHLHLLVLATIGLDVVFTIWPRLMSEFAGY